MYTVYEYESVVRGFINVGYSVSIDVIPYWHGRSMTFGRWAYLYHDTPIPITFINGNKTRNLRFGEVHFGNCFDENTKLYVSSKCSTPRDIIRNTCKIVRDINAADYVVIPNPEVRMTYKQAECVFALHGLKNNKPVTVLFLFSVCGNMYSIPKDETAKHALEAKVISKIEKALDSYAATEDIVEPRISIEYINLSDERTVYFMEKCPEYKTILESYPSVPFKYIVEDDLTLKTSVDIDFETLNIWHKMTDYNMLEKNILMSNWRDYPFTMAHFFQSKFRHLLCSARSDALKAVMTAVGYDYNGGSINMVRMISPKDWNFLQDFLLQQLGLTSDSGFVDKSAKEMSGAAKKYLRFKTAVAAKKISEPAYVLDLIN